MRRSIDVLISTATITLLLVAVYLLVPSPTALGSSFNGLIHRLTQPHRIKRAWPYLARGGSHLDPRGANVQLVEFADFQCPYCRLSHQGMIAFLARHPSVGVTYYNYPLPIHPAAQGAARAAICADDQGAFRRIHDYFFSTTGWQTDTNWLTAARAAAVPDLGRFAKCLTSSGTLDRLRWEKSAGDSLGVTGTPTFVTRGHELLGVADDTTLARLVQQAN